MRPKIQIAVGFRCSVSHPHIGISKQIIIPREAVLSDQRGDFVCVVGADDRTERRGVALGQSQAGSAVITEGFERGRARGSGGYPVRSGSVYTDQPQGGSDKVRFGMRAPEMLRTSHIKLGDTAPLALVRLSSAKSVRREFRPFGDGLRRIARHASASVGNAATIHRGGTETKLAPEWLAVEAVWSELCSVVRDLRFRENTRFRPQPAPASGRRRCLSVQMTCGITPMPGPGQAAC